MCGYVSVETSKEISEEILEENFGINLLNHERLFKIINREISAETPMGIL